MATEPYAENPSLPAGAVQLAPEEQNPYYPWHSAEEQRCCDAADDTARGLKWACVVMGGAVAVVYGLKALGVL